MSSPNSPAEPRYGPPLSGGSGQPCVSLPFALAFTQIFQSYSLGHEAAHSLMSRRQGCRILLDYAIEFRTTPNNAALIDAFLGGLTARIQEQIDLPNNLDSVITDRPQGT